MMVINRTRKPNSIIGLVVTIVVTIFIAGAIASVALYLLARPTKPEDWRSLFTVVAGVCSVTGVVVGPMVTVANTQRQVEAALDKAEIDDLLASLNSARLAASHYYGALKLLARGELNEAEIQSGKNEMESMRSSITKFELELQQRFFDFYQSGTYLYEQARQITDSQNGAAYSQLWNAEVKSFGHTLSTLNECFNRFTPFANCVQEHIGYVQQPTNRLKEE